METGTENAAAPEIDALHAAVTQQASGSTPPETEPLETLDDPNGCAVVDNDSDALFCQTILELCLARHSRAVKAEYMRNLSPVCEPEQAERIANLATMDPTLQEAIAKHGARVLKKYGVAKYVSDEAILIGSIIAYGWQRSEARQERDALLEKFKPQPALKDHPNGGE